MLGWLNANGFKEELGLKFKEVPCGIYNKKYIKAK